jgi:WD40 repeat protein
MNEDKNKKDINIEGNLSAWLANVGGTIIVHGDLTLNNWRDQQPEVLRAQTDVPIFISYSRANSNFARDLYVKLRALGFSLWRDRTEMAGGENWWTQIQDAIRGSETMVLCMSHEALASPVVADEWRYARREGTRIIPVLAADVDFSNVPRWMAKLDWIDFREGAPERDTIWAKFIGQLNTPHQRRSIPFNVPSLPEHFVARPNIFAPLLAQLLDNDRLNPIAITTALQGSGGFGKTTIAMALCHDIRVRDYFDDGILWIEFGQTPDLLRLLNAQIRRLGNDNIETEINDAATRLRDLLEDKDILIVLDDVWNPAHVRYFIQRSEKTRAAFIVTTRLQDVVNGTAAESPIMVDEMTDEQAVQLLLAGFDDVNSHSIALHRLATRLGEWALMIELVNSVLHKQAMRYGLEQAIQRINEDLDDEGFTVFDLRNAEARNQSISMSLNISLNLLSEDERKRLMEVAIFPEDTDVPVTTLAVLWDMRDLQVLRLCETLSDFSLVKFDAVAKTIRLHDVVREVLLNRLTDVPQIHTRLINNFGELTQLPDDYAWNHLTYHLFHANQFDRIDSLLKDFRYLNEKLFNTNIQALLNDFAYTRNHQLALLKRALAMAAHILNRDKTQLASQLLSRLNTSIANDLYQQFFNQIKFENIWFRHLNQITENISYPIEHILNSVNGDEIREVFVLANDRILATSGWNSQFIHLWNSQGVLESSLLFWSHEEQDVDILQAVELDANLIVFIDRYYKNTRLSFWDLRRNTYRSIKLPSDSQNRFPKIIKISNEGFALSNGSQLTIYQCFDNEPRIKTKCKLHAKVYDLQQVIESIFACVINDGSIQLFDSQGKLLQFIDIADAVISLIKPVDEGLFVAIGNDGLIIKLDANFSEIDRIYMDFSVWDLVVINSEQICVWGRSFNKDWGPANNAVIVNFHSFELILMDDTPEEIDRIVNLPSGLIASYAPYGETGINIWTSNGHLVAKLDVTSVFTDSSLGYVCENSGLIEIYDANYRKLREFQPAPSLTVGRLTKLGDTKVVTSNEEALIKVWNLDMLLRSVPERPKHTYSVHGLIQLSTGSVLSWSFDSICIWNNKGDNQAVITSDENIQNCSASDYILFYTDSKIYLCDLDGKTRLEVVPEYLQSKQHERSVAWAEILEGGSIIALCKDNTLRIWDSSGNQVLKMGLGTSVGWNAKLLGKTKVLVSTDKHLLLLDIRNPTEEAVVLQSAEEKDHSLNFLVLKNSLLTWEDDEDELWLWDFDGNLLDATSSHKYGIRGYRIVENNKLLTWSNSIHDGNSDENEVKLWNVSEQIECVTVFSSGHTEVINDAIFLDDGRLLSLGYDKIMCIWSKKGEVSTKLMGHTDAVTGAIQLESGHIVSWAGWRDPALDSSLVLWNTRGEFIARIDLEATVRACLKLDESTLVTGNDIGGVSFIKIENLK